MYFKLLNYSPQFTNLSSAKDSVFLTNATHVKSIKTFSLLHSTFNIKHKVS